MHDSYITNKLYVLEQGEHKPLWAKVTGLEVKNLCFSDYIQAFYCVDHNKLWKILQ